jgi:hypothetical protein
VCPSAAVSPVSDFSYILVRMKSFMKLGGAIALGCFAVESAARALGGSPKDWIKPYRREALQDIVSAEMR